MNGPEHFRRANAILASIDAQRREGDRVSISDAIAAAQVHATLALAAAIAMSRSGEMPVPDAEAWEAAAATPSRDGAR